MNDNFATVITLNLVGQENQKILQSFLNKKVSQQIINLFAIDITIMVE